MMNRHAADSRSARWRTAGSRPLLLALQACAWIAVLAGTAGAREWPSAALRGHDAAQPPCSCRGASGQPVEVGQEACLVTPAGRKRARCVLVLNNTSWEIAAQDCQPDLTN